MAIVTSYDLIAADAVWIATASLHKQFPQVLGFTTQQIEEEVKRLDLFAKDPKTIYQHITQHLVASKTANSTPRRMLTELPGGARRLYLEGDAYDPSRRNGSTKPEAERLPSDLRHWISWYDQWSKSHHDRKAHLSDTDPMEALEGSWTFGDADTYLREMREGWEERP